jgi:protein ImuB
MILAAPEVETWDGTQESLPDVETGRSASAQDDTIDLADRLAARLGAENVVRLLPHDSHLPERVQTTARISSDPAPAGAWARVAAIKGARPTRLLQRPEPVTVTALMPDDPPSAFHWRRHSHRIVRVEGPERVANEWWRPRSNGVVVIASSLPPARDYYRVEDNDGGRFWLFRDGPLNAAPGGGAAKWFLHGFCA